MLACSCAWRTDFDELAYGKLAHKANRLLRIGIANWHMAKQSSIIKRLLCWKYNISLSCGSECDPAEITLCKIDSSNPEQQLKPLNIITLDSVCFYELSLDWIRKSLMTFADPFFQPKQFLLSNRNRSQLA